MFETNFPTLRLIFTGKTNANDNSKNMMFSNLATWHTGTEKNFLKQFTLYINCNDIARCKCSKLQEFSLGFKVSTEFLKDPFGIP